MLFGSVLVVFIHLLFDFSQYHLGTQTPASQLSRRCGGGPRGLHGGCLRVLPPDVPLQAVLPLGFVTTKWAAVPLHADIILVREVILQVGLPFEVFIQISFMLRLMITIWYGTGVPLHPNIVFIREMVFQCTFCFRFEITIWFGTETPLDPNVVLVCEMLCYFTPFLPLEITIWYGTVVPLNE